MVCLEDNNATPENPSPSINDLNTLKNLQEGERASTPVSIVVRRVLPPTAADLGF